CPGNLLSPTSSAHVTRQKNLGALRQGLRDLGDVEDQDIAVELRWSEERSDRLLVLAAHGGKRNCPRSSVMVRRVCEIGYGGNESGTRSNSSTAPIGSRLGSRISSRPLRATLPPPCPTSATQLSRSWIV